MSDIVDWQVVVEDGTLRGGSRQQATFRIMERENGSLHPKFVRELARYRPVDEPAVQPSAASDPPDAPRVSNLDGAGR